MTRRGRRPPSQRWRTFLDNHLNTMAACDFFVVPTVTFTLLWCFVILSHDRRRIVHVNVTSGPSAEWTAQQMVEAFPGDAPAPRYLLRDRDRIYGAYFRARMKGMGIDEVMTAYRSPWQNPYAERVIGTIRRECTDHLIVLGERHLRRNLREYVPVGGRLSPPDGTLSAVTRPWARVGRRVRTHSLHAWTPSRFPTPFVRMVQRSCVGSEF